MIRFVAIAISILVAAAITTQPRADTGGSDHASPWVTTQQTQVRLIAAEDGAGRDGVVRLGLHFKLRDGWKIYWRRPGDAGFPPRLDWAESENVGGSNFSWPAPVRFQVLGFQTMGYINEVIFPITAKLADTSKPLKAHVRLDYLTCDEICIPYFAQLALDIPAGGGAATEFAALIETFAARVPTDGSAQGLSLDKIEMAGGLRRLDASARSGAVRIHASSTVPFTRPDVFIEGPELAFFGAPEVKLGDDGRRAILTVPVTLEEDASLDSQHVRLTLVDGSRSAEARLAVDSSLAQIPPPVAPEIAVGMIVLLAALGGLILNLMPCVLPVLSLKILAIARHGGAPARAIRLSFIASASGIAASFLAIATALIALKTAGTEIGWGIQFQNPWFVGALSIVTLLFAANLLGLFRIPLPGWLGALGAGVRADGGVRGPTLAGDFLTGAFATLLATPCSAPFLGTAIGFALAGQTIDILIVFAAMGFGMALPYLAVALVPRVASALPRPGIWMVRLRQILGLGLAATAVWLATIVAAQLEESVSPAVSARHAAKSAVSRWQPFDPGAIADLVADGKTVFVDITADWCLTCQVNKAVTLDRVPVRTLLERPDVVAMRGDWTRPDPLIAAYLQSFGRYAIPFNAVYGPAVPGGVTLSELLSNAEVVAALARASGGTIAAMK